MHEIWICGRVRLFASVCGVLASVLQVILVEPIAIRIPKLRQKDRKYGVYSCCGQFLCQQNLVVAGSRQWPQAHADTPRALCNPVTQKADDKAHAGLFWSPKRRDERRDINQSFAGCFLHHVWHTHTHTHIYIYMCVWQIYIYSANYIYIIIERERERQIIII